MPVLMPRKIPAAAKHWMQHDGTGAWVRDAMPCGTAALSSQHAPIPAVADIDTFLKINLIRKIFNKLTILGLYNYSVIF